MANLNDILALNRELRQAIYSLHDWQMKNHKMVLNNLDNPELIKSMLDSVDAVLAAKKHLIAAQVAIGDTIKAINTNQKDAGR